MKKNITNQQIKIGPVSQKILLLLGTGLALGLTHRPDKYFRILKSAHREWKKINRRSLHKNIKKLHQLKLIDCKENQNSTSSLLLSKNGKKVFLHCNLNNLKIKKPTKWDGLWRIVIFDIPEKFKRERKMIVYKLKQLEFYPLQKSVFVYPYECKNEIDFIVKTFNLHSYVRLIVAKEIDVAHNLKNKFKM